MLQKKIVLRKNDLFLLWHNLTGSCKPHINLSGYAQSFLLPQIFRYRIHRSLFLYY